jgi:F-type H+-transporting ATPase subunit a
MEHELWLTAQFNDHLAGLGNSFLALARQPAQERPWENYITMEILVAVILMVVATVARSMFSVDRPGGLQHLFESIQEFLDGQAAENIQHRREKYMAFFGTVFLFILFSNLIGLIPGFESPTMFHYVPAGVALATFAYYHAMGIGEHGPIGYVLHFLGPMPTGIFLLPIEIISHLARPLSLTIRLFANMFAGEQVTLVFLGMVPFMVPTLFMGLHFFVGIIQAYVFTLLAMIYVGGAVAHEH